MEGGSLTTSHNIFWSKDESDADSDIMSFGSAYVPGVTDTALNQRKMQAARRHPLDSKKKAQIQQNSGKSMSPPTKGRKADPKISSSGQSKRRDEVPRERPSLKDLRPEDKRRVANLIKELAKVGEEKEVALEQLAVERKENDHKTKELQNQITGILSERENIQQQYLECQKLLSTYQAHVSEEQKKSDSFHDGNTSMKDNHFPENTSMTTSSPVKERRGNVRVQEQHNSGSHGDFIALQPVPLDGNQEVSRSTPPLKPPQTSDSQFNPVLTSTYRPQHQSRVRNGTRLENTAMKESTLHVPDDGSRRYQLSPSVLVKRSNGPPQDSDIDSRLGTLHLHPNPEVANLRSSVDSFHPLPQVTDEISGEHSTLSSRHLHRKSVRDSSQSHVWGTLPEVGENRSHDHRQGETIAFRNHTTLVQPNHPYDIPGYGAPSSKYRGVPQEMDYWSMDPEERQRQLSSLKMNLHHEQEWLQQKLLEQEKLLQQKQREIQMQQDQLQRLSAMDEDFDSREKITGFAKVRSEHLSQRGGRDSAKNRDGHVQMKRQGWRNRDGGQGIIKSPWRQHHPHSGMVNGDVPVSTNYPPDIAEDGQGGFEDHQEDWSDEDEDDDGADQGQTWYSLREEVEGEDSQGIIQGYASLHPQLDRRKHRITSQNPLHLDSDVLQQHHQSDPISNSASTSAHDTLGPKRVHHSRPVGSRIGQSRHQNHPRVSPARRKLGDIIDLLEDTNGPFITGVPHGPAARTEQFHRTGPNPFTTRTGAGTNRTGVQPARSRSSAPQASRTTGRVPQEGRPQNPARQPRHTATRDGRAHGTTAQHTDTQTTQPDRTRQSQLVQRSHQVIQEIGLLLTDDTEVGEEEEMKVLEEVFFLK